MEWETVAALPFVDNLRSPRLFRAFYLPWLSQARNRHVQYVLLRRRSTADARQHDA
jgi:alpha-1,2-mannosyltransferase